MKKSKKPTRRPAPKKQPEQLQLPLAYIWHPVPTGDSTRVEYRAEKPILTNELTPQEFAIFVGSLGRPIPRNRVYSWLEKGVIRDDEWRREGDKLIKISVSAAIRLKNTKTKRQ